MSIQSLYKKKETVRIELAPIIDIVFILLIFFAVSTSLVQNNQGVPLDLPSASTTEANRKGITVSITPDEVIYINENQIELNTLQNYIQTALINEPGIQIILNADEALNYAFIIKVLDIIRLGGCYNIALQAEKTILQ